MVRRVALIGMNNPLSRDPARALWPDPPNCTGWRIWQMLHARTGATKYDYLQAFHRYNLCPVTEWHTDTARENWKLMEQDLLEKFDTVVLLGTAVRRAAGLLLPALYVSRTVIAIPHPSVLNRWYSTDKNRQMVELILEELYVEAIGL